MDQDFVEALVAMFKHLEERIAFVRAREPRQHDEVSQLLSRLRASAKPKPAEA